MKNKIFDIHFDQQFREEIYQGINQIFDEGFLTNHTYVRRFENSFSEFLNVPRAIAVTNGTTALEIALRAAKVQDAKVLVPSVTFAASAQAIINAGAIPELLDVDSLTGTPSINHLSKIDTTNIKAMVWVHLGGLIDSQFLKIVDWCRTFNIFLLEDCAHAHGSFLNGRPAGSLGDAGAYSFHLTKTMTTGEGGIIVSRHSDFLDLCESLRQFGKTFNNPLLHQFPSSNFKMTEFQGLLGFAEIKRAKKRIARRQEIAHNYFKNLNGKNGFNVQIANPTDQCGHYKAVVVSERPRVKIESVLNKAGYQLTGGIYNFPLHTQPFMSSFLTHTNFQGSDRWASHHFCLPNYPEISDTQVSEICNILLSIVG